MKKVIRKWASTALLLAGLASAPPLALAQAVTGQAPDIAALQPQVAAHKRWIPVAPARLDRSRGGFSASPSLQLSLGIERTVTVNGELISRSIVQVPDLRAMSAEQASALRQAFSAVELVQNGAKNTLANSNLTPGTFVQNTLNDQVIGTRTVISTTVNSAAMMKELNFMSSVRDASVYALGGK